MATTPSDHRPYVIAAIDGNHNGDVGLAKELIDAAREAGADAVKFQKRTVALAAVNQVLDQPLADYPSLGGTLRRVLQALELPIKDLADLQEHAEGMDFIVAPRDREALDALQELSLDALRIESADTANPPLLDGVKLLNLPVMASVNRRGPGDVARLVAALGKETELTLLHSLRVEPFDAMLHDIGAFLDLCGIGPPVGSVDREKGFRSAKLAMLLRAHVIEKGLTVSPSLEGPRHATSLIPDELASLVKLTREGTTAGSEIYPDANAVDLLEDESPSLVAARRIPKGTVIASEMLTLRAPMEGLSPWLMDVVVGKSAAYDIDKDQFITFGVLTP